MVYSLKAGSWKEIGRFPRVNPCTKGEFLNGALHWATGERSSDSGVIVSLDFGEGDVYGVKDSWTKLACIPYETDICWDKALDPLCISNDGKVLLKFGSKLLVYDLKDSSSTMIDNFDRCGCIDACIVVESLVSPFPPLGLADNNDDEN
ncbi:F-box associated interaction domain-containing protein [Artemisia annua]|uniref:F-box associated interaction domain-containing protein n=1 Tax=Artemisia annua TaxID=35608 RepID=A0A2U1KA25_ARTAN|nr:F-box associated interaction domain-containing protein [Artemisia annua]